MSEWSSLVAQRQQAPSTVCEVNVKSPRLGLSFLQAFPTASYIALSFNRSLHTSQHFPSRVAVLPGDRLRTVRAAPLLSGCEARRKTHHPSHPTAQPPSSLAQVLMIDTEDVKPQRGRNLLIDDLPNALQRVAGRRNTLIVSGASCELGHTDRPGGQGRGWCSSWDEFVERGLIQTIQCSRSRHEEGGKMRWCAGTVLVGSICNMRTPLLEAAGASKSVWRAQPVRLDLRGKSWRYFSVFECGNSSSSAETCLIFKVRPLHSP